MPVRTLRWSLTLAFVLVATRARAGDPVAAQALFDDAKSLMTQGRFTEACPKFQESQRLDPGLGTQFHLADCWQHVGRTASAWSLFRDVESQAHALGQVGRERVAHDRATALEPWLSKLAVDAHGAASTPGLTVRRDGVEITREQWDTAVPIDPGQHAITIYAPGKKPWETTIDVPLGGKLVTLDVPPLSDIADAPGRPIAAGDRETGVTQAMPWGSAGLPETPLPIVENRGGAQRAIGWFLTGAGVVGLAAGGYFGVKWRNDRNDSDPHCVGDVCDAAGSQLRSDATSAGGAALGAGAGGVVAMIAGVVLVATAPGPRIVSSPSALVVAPVVQSHRAGLTLQAAW